MTDAKSHVSMLAKRLRTVGTKDRAVHDKAYLKSDLEHYGVAVPKIRAEARALAKRLDSGGSCDVQGLFEHVDEAWGWGVHELRFAAIELLNARSDHLGPDELPRLELLLRTSRTWALVDALAVHAVSDVIERSGRRGHDVLDGWSADENFWIRRSALLALLKPLRNGAGDLDRFLRYADAMLDEKEPFIRKAIGWVLREVSKKRPEVVVGWVAPRIEQLSGVTYREATRRLPGREKQRLEAAWRERRRREK